jgi:putative spermidine/putrescine transport system permease protein
LARDLAANSPRHHGRIVVLVSHFVRQLAISYSFASARTNTLPVVMLSYRENRFDPTIAALSTLQLVVTIVALLIVDRIYGIDKMTVAG